MDHPSTFERPDAGTLGRATLWLEAAALIVASAWTASWSWRKWPDVLVDFGQQLYIPWRLASGQHLHTDIAFLHGPFSQLFNAAWFRLFGPSLTVLVVLNLAILALLTATICVLVERATDRLTAAATGIVLLLVFAFAEYTGTGNYNYVTPYVHEATHGVALVSLMILLFSTYLARPARATIAGAGVCLGFALLTKVDVAVAAILVAFVGLAATWILRSALRASPWRGALMFGGAALVPIGLSIVYFLTYLPFVHAVTATFGAFFSASSEVAHNAFYVRTLGFEDIAGNTAKMMTMGALMAAFVAVAAAANRVVAGWRPGATLVAGLIGGATFLYLIVQPDAIAWRDVPRALPLTTLVALIGFAVATWRRRDQEIARRTFAPMLLWATFSLALLGKILLHARVELYGFYLAMPAVLLLVVCLIYWLPKWLASRYGSGAMFRMIAIGAVAAGVVYHVAWSQEVYAWKDFEIGTRGDAMVTFDPNAFPPTAVTDEALRWIDAHVPAGATLAALPEGITLNYLSRRPTSVPVINYMMTEMIVFGEDGMVRAFDEHPPDYVVLVQKDTSEFGVGPFGIDPHYGQRIMAWVRQHYEKATVIGAEPFHGRDFGIEILKHTH